MHTIVKQWKSNAEDKNDIVWSCRVFDSVVYPDVVSWTSIISGLSKCGMEREALVRFSKMDVSPNCATIVTVLSACISIRAVKIGKSVCCYSLKNFDDENVVLGNVVLDFFVKFGSLGSNRWDDANEVRDSMRRMGLKKAAGCSWVEVD
ncbi:hypothetical protein ACET3Z_000280 [Daucus carota]